MFYLSYGEGRRLHRPVSVGDGEKETVLREKFVPVLRMKLLRYFSPSGKVIKDEERKRRKPEQRRRRVPPSAAHNYSALRKRHFPSQDF